LNSKYFLLALLFCISSAAAEKPKIIATHPWLKSIVKSLATEDFEIVDLDQKNSDPHHFDPSPSTIKKIVNADLIFRLGNGAEAWWPLVERVLKSKNQDVDLSLKVEKLKRNDPHYLLMAPNALAVTQEISDRLIKLKPSATQNLLIRRDKFNSRIAITHEQIMKLVNPNKDKPGLNKSIRLFVEHNGLSYFAETYDLQIQALKSEHDAGLKVSDLMKLKARPNGKSILIATDRPLEPRLKTLILSMGAREGGPLFVDQLPAHTEYPEVVKINFDLIQALQSETQSQPETKNK
jgi:ABC-type Zn uptake system ZnuABC Zn-binding protein ZnuA